MQIEQKLLYLCSTESGSVPPFLLAALVYQWLEAFDLLDVATCHPLSLSGGQKQRVTLAAAYCCNAELVVLDEPTSGLDGAGVMQVARWCRTLSATGKVVIIITHDRLLTNLAADAVVDLTACVIGKED